MDGKMQKLIKLVCYLFLIILITGCASVLENTGNSEPQQQIANKPETDEEQIVTKQDNVELEEETIESENENLVVQIGESEYKYFGDSINGVPHGYGQAFFDDNKVKFEGSFVQGEREGFGTSFDEHGNLMFEGEYKGNQAYNGNFYEDGKLFFTGINTSEYLQGKVFQNEVLIFEGISYTTVDLRIGEFYTPEGQIYFVGTMKNGSFTGFGKAYEEGLLVYEGQFEENSPTGEGKFYHDNIRKAIPELEDTYKALEEIYAHQQTQQSWLFQDVTIKAGMTKDQVLQILGPPSEGNNPLDPFDVLWAYYLPNSFPLIIWFDNNGLVLSVDEPTPFEL